MSVNVERCVVGPGSDEHVGDAWALKEHIKQTEGVLKQRKRFFEDAYRRSTVYCYLLDEDVIGFTAVRRDGYVLFLAVDPDFRGEGIGKRLIARAADENRTVTCHARTSNENALQFYEHLGFEIKRRIDGYYEDGGDAFYLQLGSDGGIAGKLTDLVTR